MEQILILGNGGHAASLADTIERAYEYRIAGYIVNSGGSHRADYPIIGTDEDLEYLFRQGIHNAAIGVGYLGQSDVRARLYEKLKRAGFCLPVICDPSAVISRHVAIKEGTFIGKGAIVNTESTIGKMCIINSGAIIEHNCRIGDYSHISVGSVLCGGVGIGEAVFVGANATVIQEKVIGKNCIIGAGTTIRKNMEDNSMFIDKEVKKFPGGGV